MAGSNVRSKDYLIAMYAILGGLAFFLIQASKLLRPESANIEMAASPLGRYDWGYVWSDTLIAGPALFTGGIALFVRRQLVQRIGQLLAFTGYAINLYAMIGIWVGFWALGHPIQGFELLMNIILTFLGVLCMIYLGAQLARDDKSAQQSNQS